jgi:hypothetical protein
LEWKMLVYFVVICCLSWSFGIFCGRLVYFSRFGILYQGKSGNPAHVCDKSCLPKKVDSVN